MALYDQMFSRGQQIMLYAKYNAYASITQAIKDSSIPSIKIQHIDPATAAIITDVSATQMIEENGTYFYTWTIPNDAFLGDYTIAYTGIVNGSTVLFGSETVRVVSGSTSGTFMHGFGFDGTADLPATGGERTNRNPEGTGYWDGLSYKELSVIPIGPKGQSIKEKCVAMTRALLKDLIRPGCMPAFSEDEIDMYLELSLSDFNQTPTFTSFTWDDLGIRGMRFLHVLSLGAQVMGLYAQGLIEAGKEFNITDNGIAYTPPQISSHMQSTAGTLLQHYDKLKTEIKGNMKPKPYGVGTFRVLAFHPSFTRLRHLREKRIF